MQAKIQTQSALMSLTIAWCHKCPFSTWWLREVTVHLIFIVFQHSSKNNSNSLNAAHLFAILVGIDWSLKRVFVQFVVFSNEEVIRGEKM